jgi:O-antigen/teichoic acid export membrane protein
MRLYNAILSPGRNTDAFTAIIRKNIFGGLIIKGGSIIINLLYVPLLINFLDSERYGIWIALTSFLTWFQFFDIGIGNGLRNNLTKALTAKDYTTAKNLISTSYMLMLIIFSGLALLFSFIAFHVNWSHFLNVSIIDNKELIILALIVFVGLCMRFIVQLIQPILFATQKSAISSGFPAMSNLVGLITIFLFSKTNFPPLLTAGFILSIVPVLTFIAGSFILFNTSLKHIKPGLKYVDFAFAKPVTKLGFKFLFIQIAAVVLNSSASIILIKLFGPNEVTVYNIVYKYFQVIMIVNAIIVTPLWSGFAEKFASQDYEWIKNIFKKINKLSIVLTLVMFFMVLLSPWIFHLWVGSKVLVPMVITITMGIFFTQVVFISVYNMFINGSGKIKLSMYFTAFEIIVYILLAYFLSKYVMGPIGVIVASIITKSFTFILQYVQVNKIINQTATGIWNQ